MSAVETARQTKTMWTQQQKRDMVKKQNEQRQQDIKKDTDQLLDLATELKQYVDKTNENIISLDVIKKAEQIEKLAQVGEGEDERAATDCVSPEAVSSKTKRHPLRDGVCVLARN